MLLRVLFLPVLLLMSGSFARGDLPVKINANIPSFLIECYNNSDMLVKDNLLPMTMTTLIALIRKLEANQGLMNVRLSAPALLQRFRFDGIDRNPKIQSVIPYGPSGREFYLYKFIFEQLIPRTQNAIDNDTFSLLERCTLHSMLSSSIDIWDRNDDVCNNLQPYLTSFSRRSPRSVENSELDDLSETEMAGKYQSQDDYDYPHSQCPMENGVIYHRNGALNPGLLLAGIASGLSQETIRLDTLRMYLSNFRTTPRRPQRPTYKSFQSNLPDTSIDNTWGATISGLLAEISLVEAPATTQVDIAIDGGWNDTAIPKYYFISKSTYYKTGKDGLTVPRIRGALDGKIMAKNIMNWISLGNNLKLSQLLDMYYSDNGVFDKDVKACNRKSYYTNIVQKDELTAQTYAMAVALNEQILLPVTLTLEQIDDFTTRTSSDLLAEIPKMSDVPCDQSSQTKLVSYPTSDLHIILDFSWDFFQIKRILSVLADRIQFDYNGSNFTIMSALDGTVFLDSGASVLDFHSNFTQLNYTKVQAGFDMVRTLKSLKIRFSSKLEWLKQQNSRVAGEMSHIALFIPSTTSVINDNDKNRINSILSSFNQSLPNVKILYLVPGSTDRFKQFVDDPYKDIISLGTGDSINVQTLHQVVQRISEIPRSIINPLCGISFVNSQSYDTAQMQMYLQRNEIHYFKLATNYFYTNTMAKITIQLQDSTTLNVCQSRYQANPGNSTGTQSVNCTQVTAGAGLDIWAYSSLCSDVSYSYQCNPIYISVSASTGSSSQSLRTCSDPNCRFPDMVRYAVSHRGLTCYSGVGGLTYSSFLISLIILLHFIKNV